MIYNKLIVSENNENDYSLNHFFIKELIELYGIDEFLNKIDLSEDTINYLKALNFDLWGKFNNIKIDRNYLINVLDE